MKRVKWTKTTIAKWHQRTFRDCTTGEQRLKCSREAEEYFAAQTFGERMKELADFYIANSALGIRFSDASGALVCRILEDSPLWDKLCSEIQDKMEINSQRSWEKRNGEWRHYEKLA